MAKLEIDKRLNLVLELERSDGISMFVHSTPISRSVYVANYNILSKTITSLFDDGHSPMACSRIAFYRINELAGEDEEKKAGVDALMAEIWRQTVVLLPGAKGWEQQSFVDYLGGKQGLSEDDVSEVQNYLCFFTAASWFHSAREREELYKILRRLGAQITLSAPMAFTDSLQTSKPDATTGVKATA